jgi:hypothetical protein
MFFQQMVSKLPEVAESSEVVVTVRGGDAGEQTDSQY